MFHIAKVVKNKRNKLYATNKLPFSQQTFTRIQLLQNTTRGHTHSAPLHTGQIGQNTAQLRSRQHPLTGGSTHQLFVTTAILFSHNYINFVHNKTA